MLLSVYLALPPDLAKDKAAVAVQVAGMEDEEGEEEEIEIGMAEEQRVARLSLGPWQGPERTPSQVTPSSQRCAQCPCRRYS